MSTATRKAKTTAAKNVPTAEEATFNAAVVATMKLSTADALSDIMDLNADAVAKKETLGVKVAAYSKRNAKSIETLTACQVRLAAARTALLLEWHPSQRTSQPQKKQRLVVADPELTEIPKEGESLGLGGTPDVTFYNALNVAFDESKEKKYWLAAQSYKRVKEKIESEPAELVELRTASQAAAAAFDFAQAVYHEAIKRQIAKA